jgi:hypothetical protein
VADLKFGHYILVCFAGFAEFFHYRLDQFFRVGEFLGDHADVHRGKRGIALAGAIDTVLADQDEGISDAIEGHGEAAAIAAEPLFGVFEDLAVFIKGGH